MQLKLLNLYKNTIKNVVFIYLFIKRTLTNLIKRNKKDVN
jgi:hypothetical protein